MSETLVKCEECGEWSDGDDWAYLCDLYHDGVGDWWWTCPRCGTETSDYPGSV